jgi:hypothetical protein
MILSSLPKIGSALNFIDAARQLHVPSTRWIRECKPHQGQSHKQLHAAVLAFASFCLPIAAGVKDRLFDISVCGKNTKRPIRKQRKILTVMLLTNML